MTTAALTQFYCFPLDLGLEVHNFSADTLKVVFTNTAPVLTNTVLGDITQIAAGGGYTTGGLALTVTSWTQTLGVAKLIIADYPFTATGAVATFRYIVVYNDSSSTDALIGYLDYSSTITMANGDVVNLDFNATDGAIAIQLTP